MTDASRHPYCSVPDEGASGSPTANDPDVFQGLLSGGVQDLGEPVVEELLLDWLYSFLTVEEQDRLLGWHLGVRL
ncbi:MULTISPECIES: hypothetical protein [unclassified Synechococcus]|uniref:hypothetical protein n=1 Tax=unclassified Synechococcus TaxID=2626047 RepID=UPI001CF8A22C|nr:MULTISPECIES: hypothetical protein [unclassified Synechococcus]